MPAIPNPMEGSRAYERRVLARVRDRREVVWRQMDENLKMEQPRLQVIAAHAGVSRATIETDVRVLVNAQRWKIGDKATRATIEKNLYSSTYLGVACLVEDRRSESPSAILPSEQIRSQERKVLELIVKALHAVLDVIEPHL